MSPNTLAIVVSVGVFAVAASAIVVTMLRRIHAVVAGGSDGSSEYEGADEP